MLVKKLIITGLPDSFPENATAKVSIIFLSTTILRTLFCEKCAVLSLSSEFTDKFNVSSLYLDLGSDIVFDNILPHIFIIDCNRMYLFVLLSHISNRSVLLWESRHIVGSVELSVNHK